MCANISKNKQMKTLKRLNLFFVTLFAGCFIFLSGCDQINELLKKIVPDAGEQYNAAEELRAAQGTSDKIRPDVPKGINAPKTVIKGCIYGLSWSAKNARQYCVNWSFFDKKSQKQAEGTSYWIDNAEYEWVVPDKEGVMYVNVYAKNSGGQSDNPLVIDVQVLSDNKLLTNNDLKALFNSNFSRSNATLYYKTSYYAAKCAKDAYNETSNKTMESLGFSPIGKGYYTFYDGKNNMKVDVSVRAIPPIGNVRRVIAISFRGTQLLEAWFNDITTDVLFNPYSNPFGSGEKVEIHFGFYTRYYEGFHLTIAPQIKANCGIDIFNTDNTAFLIMSHSLGGAYSEILALDLIHSGISPDRVIAIGLATPPIGNEELYAFAQNKGATSRIFKICNVNDPVPILGWDAYTLSANPEPFSIFSLISHNPFWYHNLDNTYIPYLEKKKN
jgi:hypothetical protein